MTDIISIGLDGAAWHKLDRLIESGHVPNLASLVKKGARMPLRSVNPPVTCPAWRCSTSGKNPGKLGVFWWLTLDRESGEFFHPNAMSFDTADIWDYLSEEGLESSIINIPMTYPPSELNGTMVSGFGAPLVDQTAENDSITYPTNLQQELFDKYDWKTEVENLGEDGGHERAYEVIKSRFELLLDMLEEDYDYLHLTIFYINMLQHKYGDGEETLKAWKLIDEYLGKIKENDAIIILYSDHGHSHIEGTFAVNKWLHENGYLSFKSTDIVSQIEHDESEGVSARTKWIKTAASVGKQVLPSATKNWMKHIYHQFVPPDHLSSMDVAEQLNWDESVAVATSQGPVYINRENVYNYQATKTRLQDELASVHHEEENVFASVRNAEDIYTGDYIDRAPDLMLTAADGWEIYGGLPPTPFVKQATSWTSGNHPRGILLLAGGDIEEGTYQQRSLLDLMPTVLCYLGCDIPTDIDGDIIKKPFSNALSQVTYRDPIEPGAVRHTEVNSTIRDNLKDLGYLD